MAESLSELQAQLAAVTAELNRLTTGQQLTELQVGIGISSNKYKFSGLTFEQLTKEKARLLAAIAALSNESVLFRRSSRISTTHGKF